MKRTSTPKAKVQEPTYTVSVPLEYDLISITLKEGQLRRIWAGEGFEKRGGHYYEGRRYSSVWRFNRPNVGDLEVDGADGMEFYAGSVEDVDLSGEKDKEVVMPPFLTPFKAVPEGGES